MSVVGLLVSAAAVTSLWLGAVRCGDGAASRGYRWLAGAAALWFVSFAAQVLFAESLGDITNPLSLAALAPLAALVPFVVGVVKLCAAGARHPPDGRDAAGPALVDGRALADGYVLAVALLVIGWAALFGGQYRTPGQGAGTFAVAMVAPLADAAALGLLLRSATVCWRRGALPYLSLLGTGVAGALGVVGVGTAGSIADARADLAAQAVQLLALCLLGLAPWVGADPTRRVARSRAWWRGAEGPRVGRPWAGGPRVGGHWPSGHWAGGRWPRSGSGRATIVAALAVAAATIAGLVGWLAGPGAAGHGPPAGGPVVAAATIVAGVALLIFVVRVLALVGENGAAQRVSHLASDTLRELADRTSDVVLVADLTGAVRHASATVGDYGYTPDDLLGSNLDDLVHPEDRAAAVCAARAALSRPARRQLVQRRPDQDQSAQGQPDDSADQDAEGRFRCRVRAADGTWRHVESVVMRYRVAGRRDQLLVTVRDVSDQVALRQRVAHLIFHDSLTGLPNRAYVEERARERLGRGDVTGAARGGVVFLDLDGFTAVNDSVGHSAGDLLIAQAGRRLRTVVPQHNTVARWGGDEFAVLVENAATVQEIADVAERMAATVAAHPFHVAGTDIALTASVGVAIADGSPVELVLRNADVAMSRAKEGGGARVEIYAAHMHADVVRRLELATDLRRAVARGELGVRYQPVVELATSRVTTAEALVRWWRRGAVAPPAEFLGVAEDCGLSASLGDWVLATACAQAVDWRRASWDVGVSVNLSLRQVGAPSFVESVTAALADSGLPPCALTLEVTERVLVEDGGQIAARLAELRRLGIRLAIDDFGTGYASLAYLRELPVDIIKIDPSFVAGLGRDATLTLLTRTIIQVGRDLGIQVLAEGIEHPNQLALLQEMGCGYGQGFLVARPMAAGEVESMIRTAGAAPFSRAS